jgi:hypothetical protein
MEFFLDFDFLKAALKLILHATKELRRKAGKLNMSDHCIGTTFNRAKRASFDDQNESRFVSISARKVFKRSTMSKKLKKANVSVIRQPAPEGKKAKEKRPKILNQVIVTVREYRFGVSQRIVRCLGESSLEFKSSGLGQCLWT